MSIQQKAKSLAFEKFDESCPLVEKIIKQHQESAISEIQDYISESLDFESIEETSKNLNFSLDYILEENIKNDLHKKIESSLKQELSSLEKKLKEEVTYPFREALTEACLELVESLKTQEKLDEEISSLKDRIEDQSSEITSLEKNVTSLENENSELQDEIAELKRELRQAHLIPA